MSAGACAAQAPLLKPCWRLRSSSHVNTCAPRALLTPVLCSRPAAEPRSTLDQNTKGMRTPLAWQPDTKAWATTLSVPFKLLPLSLAMVLYFPGVLLPSARALLVHACTDAAAAAAAAAPVPGHAVHGRALSMCAHALLLPLLGQLLLLLLLLLLSLPLCIARVLHSPQKAL